MNFQLRTPVNYPRIPGCGWPQRHHAQRWWKFSRSQWYCCVFQLARRSGRSTWRYPNVIYSLLASVVLLCGTPLTANAQTDGANRKRLPTAQACDMRFKLLELRVQTVSGAPIVGVTVSLRREGQTEPLRTETTSALGLVTVADDGELARIPKQGAAYTITLRKSGRTKRVPIRLGADAGGCHIAMLSGPTVVTF